MSREHDSKSGEFVAEVSKTEVYTALCEVPDQIATIPELSGKLDCTGETVRRKLYDLLEDGQIKRKTAGASAVVWYLNHNKEDQTSRVIAFPDRRELVLTSELPTKKSRIAGHFSHLVETNSRGDQIFRIKREDIWQAEYGSKDELLEALSDTLSKSSSSLTDWVERQWNRAHVFVLYTHEDGYPILQSKESELMDDVARQRLEGGSQLYRHLSDTESRVAQNAVGEVKQELFEAGYPVQDRRELESGAQLDISLDVELRDYQKEWVDSFLNAGSGVFVGPSGSGKTIAAMGAIERVAGETLILVPSRELASQWRSELLAKTHIDPKKIGEYHGGEKSVRPVTIATYHTVGMDRHRQLFEDRSWGLIIYDEVHHIPASIYRETSELQTRHRLGLTATPVREDDKEAEIYTLIGQPVGSNWTRLFERGFVQQPQLEIHYIPWESENERKEYSRESGHAKRKKAACNSRKIHAVRTLLDRFDNNRVLIFADWLEQGDELSNYLDIPFISGETPHTRREELFTEFRESERTRLIVSRIGDEGIDLPKAEIAIVTSGLAGSRRQGTQRAGRTMRPSGNSEMHILATRGTIEEEYVRRRMEFFAEKGISVTENKIWN